MASAERIAARLRRHPPQSLGADLDARGWARIPGLLRPGECARCAALWQRPETFRSRVEMERHRFGVGEYRYFASPLPPLVAALRECLYPLLRPIASEWSRRLRADADWPASLAGWLARCHEAGQTQPTPLLLRYLAGGHNRLHQDRYGALAFPLQLTVLLSTPGEDFEGGEFLLAEQRPRQQSRASVVPLARGDAVVFPNAERPVEGARGWIRAQHRHGVSEVTAGERFALGVIFHDAR